MSKKKKIAPLNQGQSFSNYILKNARKLEVFKCWKSDISTGMGHFVVARQRKNGTLVVGVYLLDLNCLGLKDTFYSEFEDIYDLKKKFLDSNIGVIDFEEIEPNICFNYVFGAIEFAEDLGFKPHKDFKITEYILDDVEDIEFVDIEFGFNGRPLFVSGENDNINRIMAILDKNVGRENYDYFLGPDAEEMEEDEDLEEDIYKKLGDIRDLSNEEFEEQTQLSISRYSDETKTAYSMFLLIHLALSDWKNVEEYEYEYKKNPKLCIEKALKYLKPKVPKEMNDIGIIANFATISIENILKFEGSEFFLLEDFRAAFEAFQKEEFKDNLDSISDFILPFDFLRKQALMAIRAYISEELFDEVKFENLNDFQKNRVADVFLDTLEDYEQEGLITTQFEEIEEAIENYIELAIYLPDLSPKELKHLILTIEILDELTEWSGDWLK